jgi:hypothetical protein
MKKSIRYRMSMRVDRKLPYQDHLPAGPFCARGSIEHCEAESGLRQYAFNNRVAKIYEAVSKISRHLSLLLTLFACIGLPACGLSIEQRSAIMTFGHSLDQHGQLIAQESTYIRSEVKAMRILTMSLPNPQSATLFGDAAYENLAQGVSEPKIERLVQIGGRASKFGNSIAEVADVTSSTAAEQKLSAATRQLALTAGAISEAASGVAIGAPAVNFVTFFSVEVYRRRYLRRELPDAEPAFRAAQKDVDAAFDPGKPDSLLSVFSAATDQLAAILEISPGPADTMLSAGDREIVANSYRVVARNRDHIKYVTSYELELMDQAAAAYEAVIAALEGNERQIDAVESYSDSVSQVHLAFQSLR